MKDLSADQWAIIKAIVQIVGAGVLILIAGWVISKLGIPMTEGTIADLLIAIILAITGLSNVAKLWQRRNGNTS